jgi:MFS-type transporter involved in bile tolerance (Atg22 family)
MASWASYQIAFLAEVVPTPKAYLFFALFNTVGRTSGFVGPFVSSAIIDASDGNTNMAFIFLVSMGLIGLVILWFVDPSKAKLDNAKCESSPCLLRRSVAIDGEDRGWADG